MPQRSGRRIDRRTALKYAGLVGTGTLLAGCTGNQDQDNTVTEGPTPTEAQAGGQEGGDDDGSNTDIVYATSVTPSSLDPMKAADELEAIITHNVYDPLLYYTDDTPPELVPWLAEDWEVSDDNTTYTLSLRDATFHNGDPVTADDVVYSAQRMLEMQQGFSYMWAGVLEPENVTAVDDSTVEMTTSEVYAPFLSTLPYMFVVNKEQVEANAESDGDFGDHGDYGTAWLEENDAGAGPYKLVDRQRKSSITLESHDDWWGEFADGDMYEVAKIDMVQEAATIVGKMKQGGADMAEQWLPLESHNELAAQDGIAVSTKATFSPLYVFLHNQKPPLDDVNVRKALSHAFDYDTMVNEIMAGDSEKLQGPLPSAMWGHADDATTYDYDLDKAKALIDDSEYAGEDINLTYHYVTGITVRENLGLMLQQDLNEIGVNLEVQKTPWSKIVSMHASEEESPQMVSTSLSFSYADPDTFLYPAWHSSAHGSWQSGSWYQNDRVDELLDEARRKVTREERAPLYQEAQQIIADEAAAIFVQNTATRWPYNERVQGFRDNGVTGFTHTFHRYHEQA